MDTEGGPGREPRRGSGAGWEATSIRSLRRHLRLSQTGMAAELGTRQQTVSEWETGLYRPRGASVRLLTIISERAGFKYEARGGSSKKRKDEDASAP